MINDNDIMLICNYFEKLNLEEDKESPIYCLKQKLILVKKQIELSDKYATESQEIQKQMKELEKDGRK